jgi:putative ATP-binding cassette transporter
MDKKYVIKADKLTTWSLIKLFWQGDQRLKAYIFLISAMALTVVLVGMSVIFNHWYNYFYNALQAYDKNKTITALIIFCILATINIFLVVYRYYITQLLALRWRRWLTHQFLNRWLLKKSYYLLESFDENTDNPDQRIQEDVGALANISLELALGLLSAVVTIPAFIYILWSLSGVLTISLGSWGVFHIPGYLVWVSILYAIGGTLLTFKIGRPLIKLNFEQQQREATFRYSAIDLRTHAENVALYRGEHHQRHIINRLFGRVLENWYAIIMRQKLLLWFTSGYGQVSVLLPLLVALPNYFNKVFLLGGLIQSLQAFGQVQDAMSYLVNAYTRIAEWKAVVKRLVTFNNHMMDADRQAEQENKVSFNQHTTDSIVINGVTIQTPQDSVLLQNVNQTFKAGTSYLIKGESGIGKSTLIRAIAGIWPYASGDVVLPADKKIMYLPQKPYMPIGTLEDAILFPDHHDAALQLRVPDVLKDCHLDYLIPRLHETAAWSEQLSPGEQQRVAFARVLLHKPDWVFLDESTSMLDMQNEQHLYKLLKEKLPNTTIVSVGHGLGLDALHDEVVDVTAFATV